jgi:predicted double-glycine peptidase
MRTFAPLIALASLGLSSPVSAGEAQPAATVLVPGIGPGAGPLHAMAPRSWKARKFDGMIRQETDFSCGAAALATIFNYGFDKRTTERQVLVNMLKVADPAVVREKGFSLLDMKRFVTAIGMSGEGFQVPFAALSELKVPGIVLINSRGYRHFVVVRKAGDDFIQVADPALGNRVISRRQFEREWNGIVFVVLGKGYDPSNALKNPPPPLSARRLFDQRSPVGDALPADFDTLSSASFAL